MAAQKGMSLSSIDVQSVVEWLRRRGSKKVKDGMARFAIPADKAFGISVGDLRAHAKRVQAADASDNHALAAALWKSGWYEARMLACFVDEPELVTPAQMDQWQRDFDNWAICDTACFALFDRTPHAWSKVRAWAKCSQEFQKRAAFALLWGLTVHDKQSGDEPFLQGLELIEQAASDERNFVKKAVNMALRSTGKRNARLHAAALVVAERLAASDDPAARWNGKDALRELRSASVTRRVGKRAQRKSQA
jgi:3-methyladenine DNA glycosylase AlkD